MMQPLCDALRQLKRTGNHVATDVFEYHEEFEGDDVDDVTLSSLKYR